MGPATSKPSTSWRFSRPSPNTAMTSGARWQTFWSPRTSRSRTGSSASRTATRTWPGWRPQALRTLWRRDGVFVHATGCRGRVHGQLWAPTMRGQESRSPHLLPMRAQRMTQFEETTVKTVTLACPECEFSVFQSTQKGTVLVGSRVGCKLGLIRSRNCAEAHNPSSVGRRTRLPTALCVRTSSGGPSPCELGSGRDRKGRIQSSNTPRMTRP